MGPLRLGKSDRLPSASNDPHLLVRQELSRILASEQFQNSERLKRFLRFVVEQKIEGSADDLKESVIGISVFDRKSGFDPKQDPIVRVTARRLREKLEDCYRSDGTTAKSTIIIRLPRGGYVPEWDEAPAEHIRIEREAAADVGAGRRVWISAASAAIALLIFAILGAWAFWGLLTTRAGSESALRVTQLTSLPGDEMQPSFSPDGTEVVFRWRSIDFEKSNLFLEKVGQLAPHELTTGRGMDFAPAWSPDGALIAFIRDNRDVMIVPSRGGSPRKIGETDGDYISWVPNSSRVIVPVRHPLTQQFWLDTIDVKSGEHNLLLPEGRHENGYMPALFSADGLKLLYAKRTDNGNDLMLESPVLGSRQKLLYVPGALRGFAFAPDERSIVYSTNSSGPFRLWRFRMADRQVSLLSAAGEESYFPVVWRSSLFRANPASGLLVYEKREISTHLHGGELSGSRDSLAARLDGSPLYPSTRIDSSPAISPDGAGICFMSERSGAAQLWCAKFGDATPHRIVSLPETDYPGSPKWHPTQRLIVFDVLRSFDRNIWVANVDTGKATQVTFWPRDQVRPSWSRDGKWIYFGSSHSGGQEIWKVRYDPSGGQREQPIQITNNGVGFEALESYDGKTLYFTGADAQSSLWQIPTSGGTATLVFAGPIRNGWWAVGAEGIYFVRLGGRMVNPAMVAGRSLDYFSFKTRRVRQILTLHKPVFGQRPDFCVSPKEDRFVIGQLDLENIDLMAVNDFQ